MAFFQMFMHSLAGYINMLSQPQKGGQGLTSGAYYLQGNYMGKSIGQGDGCVKCYTAVKRVCRGRNSQGETVRIGMWRTGAANRKTSRIGH